VPALKPAALPSEAVLHPAPAGDAESAKPSRAAPEAVALPPLRPAIEVASPPAPPAEIPMPPAQFMAPPFPAPPPSVPAVKWATLKEPPSSLEVSDLWHPGRAVQKGLHWAGKQVPLIGDADAEPHSGEAAPSAPISLLPSAAESAALRRSDAAPAPRKPPAPGPGSGGLY